MQRQKKCPNDFENIFEPQIVVASWVTSVQHMRLAAGWTRLLSQR